jgi:hypothetical protein
LHEENEELELFFTTKDATLANDIIDLVDKNVVEMLLQHNENVAVFFCE